jgi:hypothetical protein
MPTMNTPYAVFCHSAPGRGCKGGRQYLTKEQYDKQMNDPNALWKCPTCGQLAEWDDDNYEEHMGIESSEEVAF